MIFSEGVFQESDWNWIPRGHDTEFEYGNAARFSHHVDHRHFWNSVARLTHEDFLLLPLSEGLQDRSACVFVLLCSRFLATSQTSFFPSNHDQSAWNVTTTLRDRERREGRKSCMYVLATTTVVALVVFYDPASWIDLSIMVSSVSSAYR